MIGLTAGLVVRLIGFWLVIVCQKVTHYDSLISHQGAQVTALQPDGQSRKQRTGAAAKVQ